MKRKIITSLFLMFSIFVSAQTLKTYTGAFKDGSFENSGKATYTYYENEDFERIYNGSFNYNNGAVIGFFKNDKRDSIWTFTEAGVHNKLNYKLIIKGSYKDGKMNGLWTYKKTETPANKVLQSSSVFFSNGIMTGDYEYLDNRTVTQRDVESDISVKGKYDKDGFFDGDWIVKYKKNGIEYEERSRYKYGYQYWGLNRDLSTGEINKTDKTSSLSLFDSLMVAYDDMSLNSSDKQKKSMSIEINGKKIIYTEAIDDYRLNWEYAYSFWYYNHENGNELFWYTFIKGIENQDAYQTRYFVNDWRPY
jgi:hypothetical protein